MLQNRSMEKKMRKIKVVEMPVKSHIGGTHVVRVTGDNPEDGCLLEHTAGRQHSLLPSHLPQEDTDPTRIANNGSQSRGWNGHC